MNKFAVFAVLAIAIGTGLMGHAYAHTHQVVGDYKIKVGWDSEPPIVGQKNAITVEVSKASEQDKAESAKMGSMNKEMGESSHEGSMNMTAPPEEEKLVNGVSGLADKLQVDVTINGKKTFLKLVEDKEVLGHYVGDYTPAEEGFPTVHIFGTVSGTDIELTMHPEKTESMTMVEGMSIDGTVHVAVTTIGKPESGKPMSFDIAFTDSKGEKIKHVNYEITATQDGSQVLSNLTGHTHTGDDTQSTGNLASDKPVDLKITLKGIGLPTDSPTTWTGPKGDVVEFSVVPEFGSLATFVLVASIIAIIAIAAKYRLIPRPVSKI